eukprot:TRINITY_DN16737_c0_g1_i2.p2 TRINITY_DN16737_c0_g1~~TRINITY_DN16737_c0_g1_i2.p2  ORF type:complete len:120 (+),score=26.57 TRINITY_DN16737_c0_g1_i2:346-705(+)
MSVTSIAWWVSHGAEFPESRAQEIRSVEPEGEQEQWFEQWFCGAVVHPWQFDVKGKRVRDGVVFTQQSLTGTFNNLCQATLESEGGRMEGMWVQQEMNQETNQLVMSNCRSGTFVATKR